MAIKVLALVCAAVSVVAGGGPALAGSTSVAPTGRTKLVGGSAEHPVSVTFVTRRVRIDHPGAPPPALRTNSCTYSRYPCSLVDSLEISVRGRAVLVRRSVFADLADINTAQLKPRPAGGYTLTLTGGDASEAYDATIVFDDHRVRERTIIASEAGQVAEKTVYSDLSKAFE